MNSQTIHRRIRNIIASRVKTLRISKGLTQENLAEAAGLNYTHIGRIEGGNRLPSLVTLWKLADALHVNPYELLVPEETAGAPGHKKKEQLIKIIKESGAKKIEIYFTLISELRKSKS
ncbi:MAG: helix-turn-helix transcriptional regulator [Euryarchaeota archaeon]|nr:helix-turn-helix transcriptional regulator [Euryarchaeota archaeon]